MDAHAILRAQGWRGTGHSLHPTNDGTGLKQRLLMKRNDNGAGLGSKKGAHKADAWWLSAFDQALKGIDASNGSLKQTHKGGTLELDKITARGAASKYTGSSGLYSSFVRGGVLEGTVGLDVATGLPTPPDSGVGTPVAGAGSSVGEADKKETKEERKARREAKRSRKAEKQAKQESDERAARKVEKKNAKKPEREQAKAGETKEERRARRDARRKRKEEKRRLKAKSGG
ncbi:hypothetical protein GGR54DRAFT_320903 [Hypoxylon sp. NC1633]|nr:hypothetical protein GGR54DRAFT_320903 [Hypoxylon sp. NC1633]